MLTNCYYDIDVLDAERVLKFISKILGNCSQIFIQTQHKEYLIILHLNLNTLILQNFLIKWIIYAS